MKNTKIRKIFLAFGLFFLFGALLMVNEDISGAIFFALLALVFILVGIKPYLKRNMDLVQKNSSPKKGNYDLPVEESIPLNEEAIALHNEILTLKNSKTNLEKEILQLNRAKQYMIDIKELKKLKIKLESNISSLTNSEKEIKQDLDNLKTEKGLLLEEVNNLQIQIASLPKIDNMSTFSIEYVDCLKEGLDFEKYFVTLLDKLGYYDIQLTPASCDFGIDVIAYNDDILYGFQCKLYSKPVGNKAVQEAFSGKKHYNCNVVIVVTNNFFTEQAKIQAQETNVILWDRNILINKLNEASKCDFTINT